MTFYHYPTTNTSRGLLYTGSWFTNTADKNEIVTMKTELTFTTGHEYCKPITIYSKAGFTVNRILLLLPYVCMQIIQNGSEYYKEMYGDDDDFECSYDGGESLSGFRYDDETSTVSISLDH